MHVYTFSTSYSHSYPLFPPPLALVPVLPLGKICFVLLFSDFAEEKREKEKYSIFVCLRQRWLYREFPCGISM
jgi:hypothetical protein